MTCSKMKELNGFELLPLPHYSLPIITYRSTAYFLQGRQFKNVEDIRIGVQEFIDSKPKE